MHASHCRACNLGFLVWHRIFFQEERLPQAKYHSAQQSHARDFCIGGICGLVLLLSYPKYSRLGIIGQPITKYCMIFNDSKYTRWYNQIIERAKFRILPRDVYTENHHIIPRSLRGDNSIDKIGEQIA